MIPVTLKKQQYSITKNEEKDGREIMKKSFNSLYKMKC